MLDQPQGQLQRPDIFDASPKIINLFLINRDTMNETNRKMQTHLIVLKNKKEFLCLSVTVNILIIKIWLNSKTVSTNRSLLVRLHRIKTENDERFYYLNGIISLLIFLNCYVIQAANSLLKRHENCNSIAKIKFDCKVSKCSPKVHMFTNCYYSVTILMKIIST